jgi:hypothetical protein
LPKFRFQHGLQFPKSAGDKPLPYRLDGTITHCTCGHMQCEARELAGYYTLVFDLGKGQLITWSVSKN